MHIKINGMYVYCFAFLCIGIAVGCIASACINKTSYVSQERQEPLSNKYVAVDRARLIRAVLGDKRDSAFVTTQLLSKCSALGPKSTYLIDCVNDNFLWAQIDAENGGSAGMSLMYEQYARSRSCYDLYRSIYWLNKLKVITSDNLEDRYREIAKRISTCQHD